MIHICPNCGRRVLVSFETQDVIHECNSGIKAVDEEDIVKIGDWEDYTGSGKTQNVLLQGAENKLFGTTAGVEGEDLEDVTRRGARESTHRTRQHLEFIKLKGGEIK